MLSWRFVHFSLLFPPVLFLSLSLSLSLSLQHAPTHSFLLSLSPQSMSVHERTKRGLRCRLSVSSLVQRRSAAQKAVGPSHVAAAAPVGTHEVPEMRVREPETRWRYRGSGENQVKNGCPSLLIFHLTVFSFIVFSDQNRTLTVPKLHQSETVGIFNKK